MPPSPADLDWPKQTARLSIRPAEQRDAAPTFAFRTLPEVAEWVTGRPTDLTEWEAGFGERMVESLVFELDGVLIGDLMLRVEDAWSQAEVRAAAVGTQAEIGYTLDPAYAGHGFATEAVRELLRLCFEDLGLRRAYALCFADNVASWRLMERVGMRREQHTRKDSLHRDRGWLDGMGYGLLAEEWHGQS